MPKANPDRIDGDIDKSTLRVEDLSTPLSPMAEPGRAWVRTHVTRTDAVATRSG